MKYLESRPGWRRQPYVKGRKLLASTVCSDMVANGMSPVDAAKNWNLPLDAIPEIMRYCEEHRDLLRMEAEEERRLLDIPSRRGGPRPGFGGKQPGAGRKAGPVTDRPVVVTLDPETARKLDDARGSVSRAEWIRRQLDITP